MVAGHHSYAADPPTYSMKGYRSDPSASAMPTTTFPNSRVTFNLRTPVDRGIGMRVNEFRAPERNTFRAVAEERGGNFARGRGACLHYRHMQQNSKYLIPMHPVHSRMFDSVHSMEKDHEMRRNQTLLSLEQNERRRQTRLLHAKTFLQTKSLKKEIGQKLKASCSLPELGDDPCGEQSRVFKLLNRRVDVNKLKQCRQQLAQDQRKEVVKQAIVQTPELKLVMEDIARFEDDNLPELKLVLETVVDWKNSTTISWAPQDNGWAPVVEEEGQDLAF